MSLATSSRARRLPLSRLFGSIRREPMEFAGFALVCSLMALSANFGFRDYDLFKREQQVALRTLAQLQATELEQSKAQIAASDTRQSDKRHFYEMRVASLTALSFCLSERLQLDPRSPYEERLSVTRRIGRSLPECAALLKIPFNDLPASILNAQAADVRLPSAAVSPDVMGFLSRPTRRSPASYTGE